MKDAHREIVDLIPWYVNGTLGDEERERVAAHLEECGTCRADLAFEQQIYRDVSEQAAVEYMPAASLKKLQARLDGVAPAMPGAQADSRLERRRYLPWQGLVAASVAATAFAVSILGADHLAQRGGPSGPADFVTVTATLPRPPDEVIRAVFAPDLTVEQLQGVLDESQLRIVSGPTEAGVYSLASTSLLPVTSSLMKLRQHASVRFAESTKVVVEPGHSP